MINKKLSTKLQCNTQTAGIAVLNKELIKSQILDKINDKCKKHSGFLASEIISIGIYKNILNISTLTETAEVFEDIPEYSLTLNRTTLARNFARIGKLRLHNEFLYLQVKYILKKFKVKKKEIRIIVDETTIEVSKGSKYESAEWVWDNAQGKLVWGYYVTIIAIAFRNIFLPIHYDLGNMSKNEILEVFMSVRTLTKSNIVSFDGGYACDNFYETLTKHDFIFYSKVPKNYIFNNGLSENVKSMQNKLKLKKKKFHKIIANRVKDKVIKNDVYSLCFRGDDPRIIITNDLNCSSSKAFKEFKKRWDIEVCNAELKENFCFEKLPVKNIDGIIGYLFTTMIALNLVTIIKLKHKNKLGKMFNKGFKKIIRQILLVKARWISLFELAKAKFKKKFKHKWFYEFYELT